MPKAEVVLWKHLREADRHGYNFRHQHPVGPFIVDFTSLDVKLVIELDGPSHDREETADYETRRTAFLEEREYKILRFRNEDVYRDVYWVMDVILGHLPPPSRRR